MTREPDIFTAAAGPVFAEEDGAVVRAEARLRVEDIALRYDKTLVLDGVCLTIPDGGFTAIIGPNGCGKSTLLRAIAGILHPHHGSVLLDGRELTTYKPKELARKIALLAQSSITPEGISTVELVARGRFPHQRTFSRWSVDDRRAVGEAMQATGVAELSDRPVDTLSGGQRQRVWVALTLAQESQALLLDEPTTFLDIAHQVDLLNLFADLHEAGRTIVAVLHDLNHAARYATNLVVMKHGRIVAEGKPGEVLTSELIADVFGLAAIIVDDPETGTPLVIPRARVRAER